VNPTKAIAEILVLVSLACSSSQARTCPMLPVHDEYVSCGSLDWPPLSKLSPESTFMWQCWSDAKVSQRCALVALPSHGEPIRLDSPEEFVRRFTPRAFRFEDAELLGLAQIVYAMTHFERALEWGGVRAPKMMAESGAEPLPFGARIIESETELGLSNGDLAILDRHVVSRTPVVKRAAGTVRVQFLAIVPERQFGVWEIEVKISSGLSVSIDQRALKLAIRDGRMVALGSGQ